MSPFVHLDFIDVLIHLCLEFISKSLFIILYISEFIGYWVDYRGSLILF